MVMPFQPPMMPPPGMDPMMGPMPGATPMPPMDPAMMAMGPPLMPDAIMPPPPAAPPGMDIMALLADPQISEMLKDPATNLALTQMVNEDQTLDPTTRDMLLQVLDQSVKPKNGPVYPKWYKPNRYPKRTATDIEHDIRREREDYQDLILRMRGDRDRLMKAVTGAVGQFRDHEDAEEEHFHDYALVLDFQLIVTLISSTNLVFKVTPPTSGGRQDAEKIEDFGIRSREHQIARHYARHAADLATDEAKTAGTYGHIVCRRLPNFEAESDEIPINADFLDPTTCFPEFDENGLRAMKRVFVMRIRDIIDVWEKDGSEVRDTLYSTRTKLGNGQERDAREDDEREVLEFWDRRQHYIVVNGKLIHHWEHKFGFAPFVYVRSPIGDASQVNEGSGFGYGTGSLLNRRKDIASKGLSHIANTYKTHEQKEAIFGKMMTLLRSVTNPTRTIEQDMSIYGDDPMISNAEGTVSMLRMGYEREVPTPIPNGFQMAPPLLAATNESQGRGLMPAEAYGSPSGSQQSGSSIESLTESGRDKLTPWLKMLTRYHEECFEMDLRFVRDWGHLLGSDMDKGNLTIQRSKMALDDDPMVQITPDILRNGKMRTSVKMTSLRLQNLGPLGQGITPWLQAGLMEKEEALDLRGVQDARATLRRIEIEKYKDTEEYKQAMMVKWMREEGENEAADMVETLIAMKAGAGGGPPGGVPPPQMPGLGPGVGMDGGAPMGPNGPQMAGSGGLGGSAPMGGPQDYAAMGLPPPAPGGSGAPI